MVQEYQRHQGELAEGSTIMLCRLKQLDTISDIPVLRLVLGKSVLKVSKIPLKDCLGYTYITKDIG